MTTPVPVPFDPELQAALDALGGADPHPMTLDRLPEIRAEEEAEGVPTDEELSRGGRYAISERLAGDVPLLVCLPVGVTGPRPVFYRVHGGGMFTGSPRTGMDSLVDTALRYGAALISVDYRMAPEHPHPAPIDDVYAGLLWTAAHAEELGLDPARIIITGISAGGGLTAALALRVRDEGGPALLGQLLMCPMLDDRNDSISVRQMVGRDVWDGSWNGTGWTALLGDTRGTAEVPAYAAPARATDLSGLPPAFIDVGSAESLRDEDITYATRIMQAGGRAELHVWAGGYHVYDQMAPEAEVSRATLAARRSWLDRLLGAPIA
jgi:acetyl esterase/lipase